MFPDIRVGFGFDVHQLKEGRPCWIGGVLFDHEKGPDGHSDADVLLHAICDAILGAANAGDIGFHFSNTDDKWKDIDSKILVKESLKIIQDLGFSVLNVDASLTMEKPKIMHRIKEMKRTLAPLLNISEDRISIKATTNEKLGYVGREEGVNAYAVALIAKPIF